MDKKDYNYIINKIKYLNVSDKESNDSIIKIVNRINLIYNKKDNCLQSKMDSYLENIKYKLDNIYIELDELIKYNKDLVSDGNKPIPINYNSFQSRIYSMLLTEFKKNEILLKDAAIEFYNDYEKLKVMWHNYLDLIDSINQKNIPITSDRSLICSFLQITISTYLDIKENSSDERIRNMFISMEEYIISFKATSSEIGTRVHQAVGKNLSSVHYGNEIEQKVPVEQIADVADKIFSPEETIKRLNNFNKLIGSNRDKKALN